MNFRNSDEEAGDLKSAYLDSEGDMDVIIDTVLCATADDETRFAEKIQVFLRIYNIYDKENKYKPI